MWSRDLHLRQHIPLEQLLPDLLRDYQESVAALTVEDLIVQRPDSRDRDGAPEEIPVDRSLAESGVDHGEVLHVVHVEKIPLLSHRPPPPAWLTEPEQQHPANDARARFRDGVRHTEDSAKHLVHLLKKAVSGKSVTSSPLVPPASAEPPSAEQASPADRQYPIADPPDAATVASAERLARQVIDEAQALGRSGQSRKPT